MCAPHSAVSRIGAKAQSPEDREVEFHVCPRQELYNFGVSYGLQGRLKSPIRKLRDDALIMLILSQVKREAHYSGDTGKLAR